jgi:hypothetical protein
MSAVTVWLSRPGGGVRHAFRVIHVAGARTALCGQTAHGWVQDDHCDQCKRCLKRLAATEPTDLMGRLRASIAAATQTPGETP